MSAVHEAAERVAIRAAGQEDRAGYARALGFVEWLPLVVLIGKAIIDVIKDCQEPERIVALVYNRPREARKIAHAVAFARVAEAYSFFGRILWRGRIERAANDLADAMLAEAAIADPDTIHRLHAEIEGN